MSSGFTKKPSKFICQEEDIKAIHDLKNEITDSTKNDPNIDEEDDGLEVKLDIDECDENVLIN